MKKTASILLSILIILTLAVPLTAEAVGYSSYDFRTNANEIVGWKKAAEETGKCLFTQEYMEASASNADGDWYAVYMGRLGFEDYPDNYLNAITNYVVDRYNTYGMLSDKYATDYHRIALAVKSVGGDPCNVGGIDLIADGVYNRANVASLGKQGLNGWVWGLITLDSLGVQIPDGSCYTRDDIISEILAYQISDGGFSALPTATRGDADTTAMALYALAPYKNDGKAYTYKQRSTRKTVTKTVGQIIDEAVSFLSSVQLNSGGYASFGDVNSESASQVIIALCSLGIDPQYDGRFIKEQSIVDALMEFKSSDGGFEHEKGEGSNAISSEQALGAMAALERFYSGGTRLFDFTDGVIMTTFSPQTQGETPTIPVPNNPNGNTGQSSNSGSSNNNHQVGVGASSSVNSHDSRSTSNHTASSSAGGSSGGSVKATEKPTEKATSDKNNSQAASSEVNSNNNNDNANVSDNSSVNSNLSSQSDGGFNIFPFIIAFIIIALTAVIIVYLYKKKKGGARTETDEQKTEASEENKPSEEQPDGSKNYENTVEQKTLADDNKSSVPDVSENAEKPKDEILDTGVSFEDSREG